MLVFESSALHCLNQTAFVVLCSGRLCDHRCFLVEIDRIYGLWKRCLMDGRRFLYLLTVIAYDILKKAPQRPLIC